MFLLVLRLLAVYFGTAAVSLWLAHRFVSALRPRVALFLAFGPFLLAGKALLTAGVLAPIDIPYQSSPLSPHAAGVGTQKTANPILGDVVYQEIPWRKAVREAVKNGRLPLWNRFVLAGEPLLAVQQPAVFHPATGIGFLLPLAQAWTFEMALRYFLALLCAYLFLRELQCGEVPALLGAVGWAFCDYLVFFVGYPLTPAVAPLPLLLLALSRLARDADRRAVALTVVVLLLILTAGHPETLLHCVAGGGVYFLFELAFAGRKRRWRPFLLSLLAGVLALGLAAVLLLPLADLLPHTQEHFYRANYYAHMRRSMPWREAVRRLVPDVMPFYYGVSGKGNVAEGFGEPGSYAGSALWPLAVAGVFSRRREKWALASIGLLGIAVGARLPGVMDAVSALPLFDIGMNERMVFFGAFSTAALAALGLQRLKETGGAGLPAGAALAGLALAAALWVRAQPHLPALQMPSGYFPYRVLLLVIPLVLSSVFWLLARKKGVLGLGMGAALLLLIAQRGLEERDLYPTFSSAAFYPPLRSLEAIPRDAPDRMTAIGYTFIPNIATLYEVEDVRGYEAMTFKPFVETFPLWCVSQPIWYNRVDDPTRPFLAFLNVRYFLAPPRFPAPEGWKVLFSGEEGRLFENPGVLPRAFVPRSVRYESDGNRRLALLQGIRNFADQGIVGASPPAGIPGNDWQDNAGAAVKIASYSSERMTLDVEAGKSAVIATSVTAWPGWKLTVDGRRAELLSYNHAFQAFRVPPGRHTAILRYRPDSLVTGSVISLATAAIGLFLLLRPERRAGSDPLR